MTCLVASITCTTPGDGTSTVPIDQGVSYKYGDSYMYECNTGYEYPGNLISRCQLNGQWSLAPPTCHGKLAVNYI